MLSFTTELYKASCSCAYTKSLYQVHRNTIDMLYCQGSQACVFHIKRDINGVAHNLAPQHLSPQAFCYNTPHDNANCQVLSSLASLNLYAHVISTVHCF